MAFQLSAEYEALKHDINVLFAKFHQRQSVRFEDFCEEWKVLNFSCIFGTTVTNKPAPKMRLVERLFRVASEFLSEECTFLYRVAAVYTFYAVYFKQITPTKVKIRMTPTMWSDLIEFLGIVKEHQHFDVVYVIEVLRKHRAFIFCAFPKELLIGKLEFMLGVDGSVGFCHTESNNYVNDLINGKSDFQQKLKETQSSYEEIKQKVLDESTEEEIPDLNKVLFYTDVEFPDEISKIIIQHKRKYFAGNSVKPDNKDYTQRPVLSQLHNLEEIEFKGNEEGSSEEATSSQNVMRLSKFKQRIWAHDIKKSRSMRLEAPETASSETNKEEEEENSRFYKRSAMLHAAKKRAPYRITKHLRFKPQSTPNDDL